MLWALFVRTAVPICVQISNMSHRQTPNDAIPALGPDYMPPPDYNSDTIYGSGQSGTGRSIGHYRTYPQGPAHGGDPFSEPMPGSSPDYSHSEDDYENKWIADHPVSTNGDVEYSGTYLNTWADSSEALYEAMISNYEDFPQQSKWLGRAFVYGLASPFYRLSEGKWYHRTTHRDWGKASSVPQIYSNGTSKKSYSKTPYPQGSFASSYAPPSPYWQARSASPKSSPKHRKRAKKKTSSHTSPAHISRSRRSRNGRYFL